MDLNEHTLLNRPALMLTVLKAAAQGEATLQDCLERLNEALAKAGEVAPVPEDEILAELSSIRGMLTAAGLLATAEEDRFSLTERGRRVLAEHPMGVDESVLLQFPEFRAFIRAFARGRTLDDPRQERYDEGYAAFGSGQGLTENPYPPDSADHLAWENGWSEARDEDVKHGRR